MSTSTPSPRPSSLVTSAAGIVPNTLTTSAPAPAPKPTPTPPTTISPADVWTTLAATLGASVVEEIRRQAQRFVRWGRKAQWDRPNDATIKPNISPTWETSSLSLYQAGDAKTTLRVWRSSTGTPTAAAPWDEPDRWTSLGGQVTWTVPWDGGGPGRPAWKGAQGTTDTALLIDYPDGSGWEFQGMRPSNWWDRLLISLRPGLPFQPSAWDWVCDAAVHRTIENQDQHLASGFGKVPWRRGIVTAPEVTAARLHGHRGVGHAMRIVGIYMESGPAAHALAPATRVEMSALNNAMLSSHPNAPNDRLTMQGLHIASTLTESQIDTRLAVLYPDPADALFKATVKVFWMTMSEQGAIVGPTTGRVDTPVETTTMAPGYAQSAEWASNAMTSPARCGQVWNGYPYETLYSVNPAPSLVPIAA